MLTQRILDQKGVSKLGVLRLFRAAKHPMSYHTLNKRLLDQHWMYIHGLILFKANLWIEDDIIVTEDMVADARKQTPGAKYADGSDPVPRKTHKEVVTNFVDEEEEAEDDDLLRTKIVVRHE